MPTATLSLKQAKFVDEYLIDGNGSRAAVAAGYGSAGRSVAAVRLLGKACVQAAIAARQNSDSRRLQIDRQDVLTGLLEAFAIAKEKREPAAMVSSATAVGRMLGFYERERRSVALSNASEAHERRRMAAMSDAELGALLAPQGG